jgi:hypothetical protein
MFSIFLVDWLIVAADPRLPVALGPRRLQPNLLRRDGGKLPSAGDLAQIESLAFRLLSHLHVCHSRSGRNSPGQSPTLDSFNRQRQRHLTANACNNQCSSNCRRIRISFTFSHAFGCQRANPTPVSTFSSAGRVLKKKTEPCRSAD